MCVLVEEKERTQKYKSTSSSSSSNVAVYRIREQHQRRPITGSNGTTTVRRSLGPTINTHTHTAASELSQCYADSIGHRH